MNKKLCQYFFQFMKFITLLKLIVQMDFLYFVRTIKLSIIKSINSNEYKLTIAHKY